MAIDKNFAMSSIYNIRLYNWQLSLTIKIINLLTQEVVKLIRKDGSPSEIAKEDSNPEVKFGIDLCKFLDIEKAFET